MARTDVNGVRGGCPRDEELKEALDALPMFLSPGQLAELTHSHVNSVRRGILAGRIPADRVNGRWLIPAAFLFRNTYRYLEGRDGDAKGDAR